MALTLSETGVPVAARGGDAITRRNVLAGAAAGVAAAAAAPRLAFAGAPRGQLTWAVHVSLAPTWFDPAETPGIITPFMVMYALHDAMLKPLPATWRRRAWPSRSPPPRTASPMTLSFAKASSFTTASR